MILHPLPSKPAFLGPPPVAGPSTLPLLPVSVTSDNPSKSVTSDAKSTPIIPALPPVDPTRCSICSSPPKYTCPGCSLRTCSLPCSTAHKEQYSCSGLRKAESFVPLKTYGQGEWAEDYRYLEEGRRRVQEWGKGVKEDEVDPGGGGNHAGPSRGRGSGPRGGRAGGTRTGDRGQMGRRSKTHALQMELRARGVWVEFMPDGMARKKMNQSSWNTKTRVLYLTLQLTLSPYLLARASGEQSKPLGDDSDAAAKSDVQPDSSIGQIKSSTSTAKPIIHRVLFANPSQTLPTLSSLMTAQPTPPLPKTTQIVYLVPFFPSPARPTPPPSDHPIKLFFPPLDPDRPLAEVFKGTAWVEFPSIHLMEKDEWELGLKDGKYGVLPLAQPRRWGVPAPLIRPEGQAEEVADAIGAKRKRADDDPQVDQIGGTSERSATGNAGLLGALGAYASDDDDEDETDADVLDAHDAGEQAIEGTGADDGDYIAGEEDEQDFEVFDEQPGSSSVGDIPPDLLVAMSHAVDADLS